ncbi:MAG TPA: plastocyanin/azurin family copper-binding protein [Chloroflexota bacterium]|jgi:plastocyanin|nr:plastocyanin/azurin family copper-binding protein [Chloroflexota bacterium]
MPAQVRRFIVSAGGAALLGAALGLAGVRAMDGSSPATTSDRQAPPAYPQPAEQTDRADHEVDLLIAERAGAPPGTIPEFYFEPVGLAIQPGQTVRFNAVMPHHTVTAYHAQHVKPMRVPEGVPPFSSPIIPIGESWSYTFTRPGVYDLWCGPHEQFGMAMRLVVGEVSGPAAEPPTDFGPAGTLGAAGAVLSDPALAPARVLARGRVSWAELSPASKQPPAPEAQ